MADGRSWRRIGRSSRQAVLIGLLTTSLAYAERLALRTYTAADGLAHDRVGAILADSHGFIWIGTAHGLSRFDGVRFTTYGTADGLTSVSINTIIEADGDFFVGTNGGGVAWYRPLAAAVSGRRFTMAVIDPRLAGANRVNVLHRDRRGHIWAGTDGGLFELRRGAGGLTFHRVGIGVASADEARVQVWALADDAEGRLWIGSSAGLGRRTAAGTDHRPVRPVQGADHVRDLVVDPSRGVWIAHDVGLFLLTESAGAAGAPPRPFGDLVHVAARPGLPAGRIRTLHRTADGALVIGTARGVSTLRGDVVTETIAAIETSELAEDRQGNLWLAVVAGGVMRLAVRGLTTYTTEDGLASPYVVRMFETRDGRLAIATRAFALSIFQSPRFVSIRPRVPAHVDAVGRGWHVGFLEDSGGDWWVPAGDGVYRFSGISRPEDLARSSPAAFYTTRDGLAGGDIWRMFEDSRGDIWLAQRAPARGGLTRWERRTGRFVRYGVAEGLPAYTAIAAFAEDRAGQVWVGFWDGGAARHRHGRFEPVPGLTDPVVALYVSRAGTLWGGSLGAGVLRIDQPAAPRLDVETLVMDERLRSNQVQAIVEDDRGRLYFGTAVGVTRLDPSSGSTRHYGVLDGLARAEVSSAHRDRAGALWFGTTGGVSRLRPGGDEPDQPARLLINAARVNGSPLPIPDLGAQHAGPFDLGVDQQHVEIDYVTLGQAVRSDVEYRLEGEDVRWKSGGSERTVHYAGLRSGAYRFVVRTPAAQGWTEASLSFGIRPPFWQRWWFLLTSGGAALGILVLAHRSRVARLLALERVRTRIASDLHDDIGTNLSQIAILGELLQRRPAGGDRESLARIADLSRESVDSLSDIVWSIDPGKDRLGNLVTRMRRLANDLLSPRDIAVQFAVHGDTHLAIGADVRRDVFLAFKETLHNIVRHAACRVVTIDVRLESGRLAFAVTDDGRGFDSAAPGGHGLSSLRRRAERLGGEVTIKSAPGAGTSVRLSVPTSSRRRRL